MMEILHIRARHFYFFPVASLFWASANNVTGDQYLPSMLKPINFSRRADESNEEPSSRRSGYLLFPSRPHKIHRRGEKGKGNCFSRLFLPSDIYIEPAQGPAPFFFFIIHSGETRREAAHRPTFHSMIPFYLPVLIPIPGLYDLY